MVPHDPVLKPKNRLIDPLSSLGPTVVTKVENKIPEVIKNEVVIESVKKEEPVKITTRRSYKKIFIFIFLLVIVASGIFFARNKINFSNLFSPSSNTPTETVGEVGKLISLPQNEEPTIMTVTDLTPLAGQAFFAEAKVGDKVLLYSVSKRAILYRPSEKRIITTATLNQ